MDEDCISSILISFSVLLRLSVSGMGFDCVVGVLSRIGYLVSCLIVLDMSRDCMF